MDLKLSNSFNNITRPEKNKDKFSGYIMYMDEPTVMIEKDEVIKILSINAPLHFKAHGRFESWMESRLLDTHRANSRRLRKRLSLVNINDIEMVRKVHASSLVDQYWVKEFGSNLDYNKTHNFSDVMSITALTGDLSSYNDIELFQTITPEITNIGSFEKCWKYDIHSGWELVKKGSSEQNYSEILAYKLGRALGFKTTHYRLYNGNEGYVISPNFIKPPYNFEPMYSLIGEEDDELLSIKYMNELGVDIKPYLDILFLDSIICNTDRHSFNYGLVSDNKGKYKVAPNFDNNLALIATPGLTDKVECNIGFTKIIHKILKGQGYVKPYLDMDVLSKLVQEVWLEVPSIKWTVGYIYDFIKLRYDMY